MTNVLSGVRQHAHALLLALSFFTRIPVGHRVTYSNDAMHHAGKYFALVGWVLAGILSVWIWLLSSLLPASVLIFLVVLASVLLTGAFHEDGLADTADAFGGGQDKDHKLIIMKDSRLGTYGVCALVGALFGKWVLLTSLVEQQSLVLSLFVAYPLSRAFALSHVQDLPYATESSSGKIAKSMPFATPYSVSAMAFLFITGGLALLLLPLGTAVLILVTCILLRHFLKYKMLKHVQGFTGDTLGAAQQIQELTIYLMLLIGGVS
ncbi:adenosylcobinamide-GDP ribazoletransferase [Alteromonas confluentis]|uniref:Adenosylcobinamide-GDP ribazoletransferase n=1 Tax=Alteromonas confluentis TaxID=1656094 RepID=A0A1E7ZEX5_9ALTE|nr:adenosylcobinamide-GDP ribazoletransferase [Alteromonas confluentis]OFC72063.1 hypothetical protein BFC18_05000 [Alteromonas confluentis]